MKINTKIPICKNPHWIGDYPAWDIILTNGEIHYDVTEIEIGKACWELQRRNEISLYSSYILGCVNNLHIGYYNKFQINQ